MGRPDLRLVRKYTLRSSVHFYSFERSWIFFRLWKVDAMLTTKIGSIWYQGPFCYLRGPATWIDFEDTSGFAQAIESGLSEVPAKLSISKYKQLLRRGDLFQIELGLKSHAETARRTDYFCVEDYGGWLRLYRLPWGRGGYTSGYPDWEELVRVTPTRAKALERAAVKFQKRWPPRGFDFFPSRGLVREKPFRPK